MRNLKQLMNNKQTEGRRLNRPFRKDYIMKFYKVWCFEKDLILFAENEKHAVILAITMGYSPIEAKEII